MGCKISKNSASIAKKTSNKINDLYSLKNLIKSAKRKSSTFKTLDIDLNIQKNHLKNNMFKKLTKIYKNKTVSQKSSSPISNFPSSLLNSSQILNSKQSIHEFSSPNNSLKMINSQNDSNYASSLSEDTSKTSLKIKDEFLNKFFEIEKEIRVLERKIFLDEYLIQTEQLDKLEKRSDELKVKKYRYLEDLISIQNKMGFNNLKLAKDFISSKIEANNILNLEEELFLDIFNNKETIEKEAEDLNEQQNTLKKKIDQSTLENERLQKLFSERDQLLDQIFDGQYGSNLENHLEQELDWLLEQKHHIDQAYFKWKQAYSNVKQACKKLTEVIYLWKNYIELPLEYQNVVKIKNLLLTASQQLKNCQQYLNNIELPYCSKEEIETLDKAISYIFTDMHNQERHEHALICYQTSLKRADALKQWLKQVIDSTISLDQNLINEDCKLRTNELRNERIRLIKLKINKINIQGSTNLSTRIDLRDSGIDSEIDDLALDEQIAKLFDTDDQKDSRSLTLYPASNPFPLLTSSQLDLEQDNIKKNLKNKNHKEYSMVEKQKNYEKNIDEKLNYNLNLATPINDILVTNPTSEQIFDRINELKQRFKTNVEQVRKQQQFSQAKIDQGLKEKLDERRHRRSRAQMNEREVQALNN